MEQVLKRYFWVLHVLVVMICAILSAKAMNHIIEAKLLSVKRRAGDDHGAQRVRGVVTAADDAGFDLTLDDGGAERITYADVTQARTVFEWGNEPKRANTKKQHSKSKSKREPVRR